METNDLAVQIAEPKAHLELCTLLLNGVIGTPAQVAAVERILLQLKTSQESSEILRNFAIYAATRDGALDLKSRIINERANLRFRRGVISQLRKSADGSTDPIEEFLSSTHAQ